MARKRSLFDRLWPGRAANDRQSEVFGPQQEAYVLRHAGVPEHIPGLMAGVSAAAPCLVDDHLCFTKENWLIFVGYPLEGPFSVERCTAAVNRAVAQYHPRVIWFIGPQVPAELAARCCARQTDVYYRLDLPVALKPALRRAIRAAAANLTVRAGRAYKAEHVALADELMARTPLPAMVAGLYRAMPDYVARSATATVLEARTATGALAAFYVVEEAAPAFDVYVLAAYTRHPYVPHASDLLCAAMIERAQAAGKHLIHLGLGVNAGIRRFKEKWGGVPFLTYEFCECRFYSGHPMVDLLLEWKL